jgi:Uma2 family endonuclease
MQLADVDMDKIYSYADYLKWQFDERIELLKGRIFKMGAPNFAHQAITGELYYQLRAFLQQKSCRVFVAPFDVRLPRFNKKKDKEVMTVVQPDLCVVCDLSKLDDRGCIGAPDMVVEILSPGNSKKEMRDKFEVYQESGVKEYWVVNPLEKHVLVFVLNEKGQYIGLAPFTEDMVLTSAQFPGLALEVKEIFPEDI